MLALQRAAEAHDVEAMIGCLAGDVVVRSPITRRIEFHGIEEVGDLLRRVFALVEEIRFYETVGEAERVQAVFWRGRVGGQVLEEANLLRLDEQGLITEMTVFMRPIPGLLVLASGLASSLARRRGRVRALIVTAMLAPLARVFAAGEPVVVRLADAGVKAPADPAAVAAREAQVR